MFYKLFSKILFLFNPEEVHYFTLGFFKIVRKIPVIGWFFKLLIGVRTNKKLVQALGLTFKNPVGLAAGFDKDARYIEEFKELGFGFMEVGTVTPLPQPGNPKPRLFRLIKDTAIINRMGFNNNGVDEMVRYLRNRPKDFIVGGNIGKNKNTPNENAVHDYSICFQKLYSYVDYFVVNVSSPNTPGLRELQDKEPLKKIFEHLLKLRADFISSGQQYKPILLKIAPDLATSQLDDVIEIVSGLQLDGVVATNTTISREGLATNSKKVEGIGAGGLSGTPLTHRSTEVVKYLSEKSHGKIFIIGVGGICTAKDAQEKFTAGATLVQLYTGFIYSGPKLITDIVKKL